MVRSLNGLSTGSVRSLNGLNVDTITADLPVLITNRNITIEGLNGFGTAGQIIKVNSEANGLEYANDSDTLYTVASPLELSVGNQISLNQTTLFASPTIPEILNSEGRVIYEELAYFMPAYLRILLGNATDDIQVQGNMFIKNLKLEDASASGYYNIVMPEIEGIRNVSLPLLTGNDEFVFKNHTQTLTNKTITGTFTGNLAGNAETATQAGSITGITNSNIVQLTTAQTLTNKTIPKVLNTAGRVIYEEHATADRILLGNLTDDIQAFKVFLAEPKLEDATRTGYYDIIMPEISANRDINLPDLKGNDTFVFANEPQTLYGKTLDQPIISQGMVVESAGLIFSPSGSSNNWYPCSNWDGNVQPFGSLIGGSGIVNTGGIFREYCWAVESSSGSFRALGLFTNNNDLYGRNIGSDWTFMGYFKPALKTNAYSFTASHRCYSENNDLYNDSKIGLIVVSTGKYDSLYIDDIDVDNAVPMVELCSKRKCKSVLGVIAKYEKDNEDREGMDFGFVKIDEKDKNRLYINSIGEGAIWVCNSNGNFENGDYIQSSNVAGYGELQEDDLLHNYSIAKITMDIDFNNIPNGFKTRTLDNDIIAVLCGCIYQQG